MRATKPAWANTNESELAAFCGYALSFPGTFLALVDTYDTVNSGLENFIMVAVAIAELGCVQGSGSRGVGPSGGGSAL